MVLLSVPEGLTRDAWRARWASHTPIALATQATFRYVQTVVVRPLTDGAPEYAAIMEECFPMAAATDNYRARSSARGCRVISRPPVLRLMATAVLGRARASISSWHRPSSMAASKVARATASGSRGSWAAAT